MEAMDRHYSRIAIGSGKLARRRLERERRKLEKMSQQLLAHENLEDVDDFTLERWRMEESLQRGVVRYLEQTVKYLYN